MHSISTLANKLSPEKSPITLRLRGMLGGLSLCLLLVCAGCGKTPERPFTDNSKDPQSYAADVKALIIDHVALAKKSKEPADEMQIVVNFLGERSSRPQGEFADTYAKLYDLAEQIHAACEAAGGKPSGLDQQLQELLTMAETLPGTVDSSIGKPESN